MSRKFGKSMFVSAALAALAVSATSLALASIPGPVDDSDLTFETSEFPEAASGVPFFTVENDAPMCFSADQVLSAFADDRALIGGETVTLEAGFDQAFANQWRRGTKTQEVTISGVYAHIFDNASGFKMVDVVELGTDGCAISRTLLTDTEWTAILVKAAGVEV
jgi:hypothetical protein